MDPHKLFIIIQVYYKSKYELNATENTLTVLPLLTRNGVQLSSLQSNIMCSTTARWLFWSDRAAGKIHRSRLDGSSAITLIADDVTSPQGLVVDSRMKRCVFYLHQNRLEICYLSLHWPISIVPRVVSYIVPC